MSRYLQIEEGEKVELGKTSGQLWEIPQLIIAQIKSLQKLEMQQTALQAAYAVVLQRSNNQCTAMQLDATVTSWVNKW